MYKLLGTFCIVVFLGGCSIVPDNPDDPAKKEISQTLPPEYLNIDGFRSCLSIKSKGLANFYCMPEIKPKDCRKSTWNAINNLKGSEKIPACSNTGNDNKK